MKWVILIFVVILSYLQYRLWFDEGGVADLRQLEADIEQQQAENSRLLERNRLLAAQVDGLKQGDAAVEERARTDLGMIKTGETFYMVLPDSPDISQ